MREATDRPFGVDILFATTRATGDETERFTDAVKGWIEVTLDERRPFLARGDGDQLDAGVPQQDANKLKGRVARTAEDGNACHDGFSMVVPDAITTSYV